MHGIQFVFQRSHSTEELSGTSCVPKIQAAGHWQANQPLWPKQNATKMWHSIRCAWLYQTCLPSFKVLYPLPSGLSPNLQGGSSPTHLEQGSYWTAGKTATQESGRQGHQERALPEASVQFPQRGYWNEVSDPASPTQGSPVLCHAWELPVCFLRFDS